MVMKSVRLMIISLTLFISIHSVNAQWAADPANPGIVTDAVGVQNNVRTVGDGNEGIFVFWLDNRSNPDFPAKEIYGQHYDASGFPSWEENGRKIIENYNRISSFSIGRYSNGDLVIGWLTQSAGVGAPDSLWVNKLDNEGNRVWDSDLVIGSSAVQPPNNIQYIGSFNIIRNNDQYYALLRVGYGFGFDGNRYTHFTGEGVLTGPVNGWAVGPQSYYGGSVLLPTYDGQGDVFFCYSTGNGAGAALNCIRAASDGNQVWGPYSVTQGTSGLQYGFSAISDENGVTCIWQGADNSVNYYARRVTNSGAAGWGGNTTNICNAEGTQDFLSWSRTGATYFAVWGDARPGTNPGYYDIYAQKFDTTGALHWQPNGIEIASFNTYTPVPRYTFDAEGNLIVTHISNVSGFIAQKVTPDGQLPWGPEAKLLATMAFVPNGSDYAMTSSGDNTITAWSAGNSGSENIYITRANEVLYAGLGETAINSSVLFPNPAKDYTQLILPDGIDDATIMLTSLSGQQVGKWSYQAETGSSGFRIPTGSLVPGVYSVSISSGTFTEVKKLLVK